MVGSSAMTFKDWVSKIIVGDDCSVYDGIMEGDYVKRRDVLNLVEEAFEAGHSSGYCEGLNHGYEDSKKVYNEG